MLYVYVCSAVKLHELCLQRCVDVWDSLQCKWSVVWGKWEVMVRNRRLCSRCSPIMLSENILFMLKFSPIMLHPWPIMLELCSTSNSKNRCRTDFAAHKKQKIVWQRQFQYVYRDQCIKYVYIFQILWFSNKNNQSE